LPWWIRLVKVSLAFRIYKASMMFPETQILLKRDLPRNKFSSTSWINSMVLAATTMVELPLMSSLTTTRICLWASLLMNTSFKWWNQPGKHQKKTIPHKLSKRFHTCFVRLRAAYSSLPDVTQTCSEKSLMISIWTKAVASPSMKLPTWSPSSRSA
jgi:hypothetical protein